MHQSFLTLLGLLVGMLANPSSAHQDHSHDDPSPDTHTYDYNYHELPDTYEEPETHPTAIIYASYFPTTDVVLTSTTYPTATRFVKCGNLEHWKDNDWLIVTIMSLLIQQNPHGSRSTIMSTQNVG